MKSEILRLLKESEGYVSGQQLCEQFQVSRTAVWKVVDQLKKEGYEIEAVPRKGYRLVESPDVLSEAELESLRSTKWAGKSIFVFKETDSTNIQAKAGGEKGEPHGTLYVAESQSAGRGRRGRRWESPAGESIYMSLLLRPEFPPVKAPMLTLVMALAVARALREQTGVDVQIKWPNDLVVQGRKICGSLTEMSIEMTWINYVVIGIGINVNQNEFPEELKDCASSLKMETGRRFRRSHLIAAVMEHFEMYYEQFLQEGSLAGLRKEYNELLVNKDRPVKILEPGNHYEAYALGINDTGELIVEKEDGSVQNIFAGEVSVRGIYGYT